MQAKISPVLKSVAKTHKLALKQCVLAGRNGSGPPPALTPLSSRQAAAASAVCGDRA